MAFYDWLNSLMNNTAFTCIHFLEMTELHFSLWLKKFHYENGTLLLLPVVGHLGSFHNLAVDSAAVNAMLNNLYEHLLQKLG